MKNGAMTKFIKFLEKILFRKKGICRNMEPLGVTFSYVSFFVSRISAKCYAERLHISTESSRK